MYYLIFIILYLLAVALNLLSTLKQKEKLFAITKPLLMLLLALYCVFREFPFPDRLLLGALLACWLGDVLLIPKGNRWLTVGGLAFLAGHILFILNFAKRIDLHQLPLPVLIPVALLYLLAGGFVMARIWKQVPWPLRIPMAGYLLCNAVTNLFALTWLLDVPGLWPAVAYAGSLLFFLSDSVLLLARFDENCPPRLNSNFLVMSTYTAGVLLITLGLAPI